MPVFWDECVALMDSEPTKGPDETLPSGMGSSHGTSNKIVCLTVMEANLAVNSGLFSQIAYAYWWLLLCRDIVK